MGYQGQPDPLRGKCLIVKLLRTDLSAKPAWLLVVLTPVSKTSVDLGFPNLKMGASNKIWEGWLWDYELKAQHLINSDSMRTNPYFLTHHPFP